MTIKAWLEAAVLDAERRGMPELKPLLEMLARATSALRTAEWNTDASGEFHTQEPSGSFDPRAPIPDPRNGR
jgi:hypothetical protein